MAAAAPVLEIDADALREFRMTLARAAKGFRRYPALARERNWEGVVRVQLEWGRGNGGAQVKVVEGSGYPLLDEQALAMLQQAVRRTPLPEGLQGRSFELILPVEFSLQQP